MRYLLIALFMFSAATLAEAKPYHHYDKRKQSGKNEFVHNKKNHHYKTNHHQYRSKYHQGNHNKYSWKKH